jgi:hypothetical protein
LSDVGQSGHEGLLAVLMPEGSHLLVSPHAAMLQPQQDVDFMLAAPLGNC